MAMKSRQRMNDHASVRPSAYAAEQDHRHHHGDGEDLRSPAAWPGSGRRSCRNGSIRALTRIRTAPARET